MSQIFGGVPGPGRGGPRSQIFFRGGRGSHVSDFLGGGPRSQVEGGPRSQIFGGVPGLRFFLGGSQVSDFRGGGGGPRSQIFRGVPGLQIFGGGPRSR